LTHGTASILGGVSESTASESKTKKVKYGNRICGMMGVEAYHGIAHGIGIREMKQ